MRGELVTVAMAGDFGTPRPALVIQGDRFDGLATATVLLVSGTVIEAPLIRIDIEPSPGNGLRKLSQVMVDKAITVRRERIGPAFGRLDAATLLAVERCLVVFLGIAR